MASVDLCIHPPVLTEQGPSYKGFVRSIAEKLRRRYEEYQPEGAKKALGVEDPAAGLMAYYGIVTDLYTCSIEPDVEAAECASLLHAAMGRILARDALMVRKSGTLWREEWELAKVSSSFQWYQLHPWLMQQRIPLQAEYADAIRILTNNGAGDSPVYLSLLQHLVAAYKMVPAADLAEFPIPRNKYGWTLVADAGLLM